MFSQQPHFDGFLYGVYVFLYEFVQLSVVASIFIGLHGSTKPTPVHLFVFLLVVGLQIAAFIRYRYSKSYEKCYSFGDVFPIFGGVIVISGVAFWILFTMSLSSS